MVIIICALFILKTVFAERHILQTTQTLVCQRGVLLEFTEVSFIDGVQFSSYRSKGDVPSKVAWLMGKENDQYLNSWKEDRQNHQDFLKTLLVMLRQSDTLDGGRHTLQRMYAYEPHDDTMLYDLYGHDGEDLLSCYNASECTRPSTANDTATKNLYNFISEYSDKSKESLRNQCFQDFKMIESNGNGTLKRKVRPEPLVFLNRISSELVCHVTGFYPKSVTITWRKDGEDVNKDMELRDTLPNHNGTFQKRSLLKVPAEDLQKHNYTCVIQHSSLEKELVVVMEGTQLQIHNPRHTIPNISKGGEWRTVIPLVITLIIAVGILI